MVAFGHGMARYRFLSILFALVAAHSQCAQAVRHAARQPSPGTFDLSGLPSDGYVELDGAWDFWPDRFVDPAEASTGRAAMEVRVPSHWDESNIPGLSSTGFATYHVRIVGIPKGMILGLKLTSTLSTARVFADGVDVLTIGRPSTDASTELPRWDSRTVALPPDPDGILDLVVQVSNYVDFSGGIIKPVILGDNAAVTDVRTSAVVIEMFEVGALVVIGFYCLFIFAYRPKDRHTLYFGVLALVLGMRTLFYDEFLILTILPSLSFAALFRIGYLTFGVPFALLAGFFRHLFPRLFPKWLFRALAAFSACFALYVLFAPLHLVAFSLFPTEGVALVFGVIVLVVLVRAVAGRSTGSLLLSFGFLMFFFPVIYDILVTDGAIHGPYIAPFGMILFFLTLALTITRNFAIAFEDSERLAKRLSMTNRDLSSTIDELNRTQGMLVVSEKLNSLGKLAAGVAHEINTPLAAVISANESSRASLERLVRRLLPGLVALPEDARLLILDLSESILENEDVDGDLVFLDRKSRRDMCRELVDELPALRDRAEDIVEYGLFRHREILRDLMLRPEREIIFDTVLALSEMRRAESIVGIAAGKAADVVRALRNYLGKGEDSLHYGTIVVEKEIESILVLYKSELKGGVEIAADFSPGLSIRGDRQNLGQVWINLINNALQAMEFRGRLEIRTVREGSMVVVRIRDSGPGIPAEIGERIFEPFFTTKKGGEGLGLGLDICRKIVERHGGSLTFESEPGNTVFVVSLPAEPA